MEPIPWIEFSAMYTEKLKRHAHADRDRCDRFEVARNAREYDYPSIVFRLFRTVCHRIIRK